MSLTFYTKTPANASAGECKFASSGCWHFFVFRNSVEKLCVSWALPFNKHVRVWACKIRKPHTHVFVPTSHKVFLRNYWNPKEPATNICHSQIIPIFFYLSLITKRKNAYINLKSMLYCYRQLNMVRIGNAQSSGMITNNT